MSLQIIGAGFGRTGTLSLKQALETLGYNKCYHMAEVAENPSHVELWRAAWRGEDTWETLFAGYQAAVDWPAAAFWPRLMERYPEAKVILSVRDPARWYKSATATIFASMQEGLRNADATRKERLLMAKEIIIDGTFGGDLNDRANAIAVYEANVARVYRDVPAERLVIFDPADGWPSLCAALGVPVPKTPFPHINTTDEFNRRWRRGASPNRELARDDSDEG